MRVLGLLAAAPLLLQAQAQVHRFALPNGLQVILVEDHDQVLFRARLHVPLPLHSQARAHRGVAPLALRLLDHAVAGSLAPDAFDRALAAAGLRLDSRLSLEGLDWDMVARSRDQERALDLLASRVARSLVEPGQVDLQRDALRQTLGPSGLARALAQAPQPGGPAAADLEAATYEQVLAFRQRFLRPDRSWLILHGDLGREQAKRLALLSLGTWTAVPELPPDPPDPLPPPQGLAGPALAVPEAGGPPRVQAVALQPAGVPPEAAALLARLLPDAAPGLALAVEGPLLRVEARGSQDALAEGLAALRRRGFEAGDLLSARKAWTAGEALSSLDAGARMDLALWRAKGQAPTAEGVAALSLEALNDALRRWLDPAGFQVYALGPQPPR